MMRTPPPAPYYCSLSLAPIFPSGEQISQRAVAATLCACAGYVAGPTSRQVIAHDDGAWCVYLACQKGPCHAPCRAWMWIFSVGARRPTSSPARSLVERLVGLLSGAHTARGRRGTGARCCSAARGPGGIRTGWLGGAPHDGPRPSSSSVPTHLVTVQS